MENYIIYNIIIIYVDQFMITKKECRGKIVINNFSKKWEWHQLSPHKWTKASMVGMRVRIGEDDVSRVFLE